MTIHLWHHFTPEAETKAMQDLADRFHAANPNVTIDITVVGASDMVAKTNAAMQANEPPDIFSGWGGAALGNYVDSGLVKDLTDAFAANGWKDTFLAGPLALYTLNDRIYGVPIRAGAWGLWYDSELFAKAAITGCPPRGATCSPTFGPSRPPRSPRSRSAAKTCGRPAAGGSTWPSGSPTGTRCRNRHPVRADR